MVQPALRPMPTPPPVAQVCLLRTLFSEPQPALDQLAGYGPILSLGAGPSRFAIVGAPTAVREMISMPTDRFRGTTGSTCSPSSSGTGR